MSERTITRVLDLLNPAKAVKKYKAIARLKESLDGLYMAGAMTSSDRVFEMVTVQIIKQMRNIERVKRLGF